MAGGGGRELDSCPGRRNTTREMSKLVLRKLLQLIGRGISFFFSVFLFFFFFSPLDGLGIWEMGRGRSGNHNLEYGARRHGHFSYHAALV